jgi:transcriptional regulator of acetoin/glycerol metabolism
MRRESSHADKVRAAAEASDAARSRLAASWHRSINHHGLDPAERRRPLAVDAGTLTERRQAAGHLMAVATPRLDQLFSLVGLSGCAVLLTDATGLVIDHRASPGDAPTFRDWGLWSGVDWSEAAEGTNGIGTCLAEERRVIIHRDEHFHDRNTAMSCLDAPIWGSDGRLLAALDVSSARADQTEAFNRLIAAQVAQTARAIEEALFRADHAGARVLSIEGEDPGAAVLLAVNADDLVIGATRAARRQFGLGLAARLPLRPAADLLGQRGADLDQAERAALVQALARAGGNASAAARALGIGRATLYRRLERLGIVTDRDNLSRN